jgi:uncharacterized protein (DUF2062 family)
MYLDYRQGSQNYRATATSEHGGQAPLFYFYAMTALIYPRYISRNRLYMASLAVCAFCTVRFFFFSKFYLFMRSFHFFTRLPTAQSLKNNRFLKPFGAYLHHHFLWQFNRRSVANGVAIGLFFGFLLPFAQILLAAVFAVVLRANLPVAAFCTLVTNPFTFPPIYYFAYKLGNWLTGWLGSVPQELTGTAHGASAQQATADGWSANLFAWVSSVGLPLSTGLAVLAVVSAALGYFVTNSLWRWHAARRWHKRRAGERPPV